MQKSTLLFTALIAASVLPGCKPRQETVLTREPVTVGVMAAECTEITQGPGYVGRVEASRSTVVLSEFPGTVESLCTAKGARVSKGSPIAQLSSESVKSAHDVAQATLAQATDGYERANKVYSTGSITEAAMIDIRTKLENARTTERSTRKALEDLRLTAPFPGVVGDIYVHEGEHVLAAAPVAQILDVSSVEIHFSIPENEYGDIRVGDKAEVEVPALGRSFKASVAVKGVTASPLSHSYDCTLKDIRPADGLVPGMVCKVRIRRSGGMAITVPSSAVMTDMNGRFIWGVGADSTVTKTYVTVGGYSRDGVIISEGLSEGDLVITEGSRKVSTGMSVKTVRE